MLSICRRVFLFVGMVVGAGFATGRELVLYFYGKSILTIVLAGVFMGLMFAVFSLASSGGVYRRIRASRLGRIVDVVVFCAVIASFIVMTSGAEELLYEIIGVRYLGTITGILSAVISVTGLRGIKSVNLVLVPVLIALTIIVTHGSTVSIGGKFSIGSSITYVGLNMLTAGYLMLVDEEKVSHRDIVISSTMIAVIFSVMLVIMLSGISIYHSASMPLYTLALSRGLGGVGGLIIYLSILSTLIGDAKIIYDRVHNLTHHGVYGVAIIAILSIMARELNFSNGVSIIYSIEGVVGFVFIVYVIVVYSSTLARYEGVKS